MLHGFLLLHKAPQSHPYPAVQVLKESFHIGHTKVVAKPAKCVVQVMNDLLHVLGLLTPSEEPHPILELVQALDARPKIPPMHQEPDKIKRILFVLHDTCLLRV